MCAFVQIFKPELCDIAIEKDYDQFYKYNLRMIYKDYTLDQEFESRGIKRLWNFLSIWICLRMDRLHLLMNWMQI